METANQSYERHAVFETNSSSATCFTNADTIDTWRHIRMIETISPLIRKYSHATFLTIGDKKGFDAFLLRKYNVDTFASSLTDTCLKDAKERGYIDKYQVINAEQISFEDNSFDFVFCKASYHHFPRPPIAFYEMLRVARIALILIEPTDDHYGIINAIKRPLKRLIRKSNISNYEPCGNYIFRVNSHELKKMLMAINKPFFGIKYYNDFFLSAFAGHKSNWHSIGYIVTRFAIFIQDFMCFVHFLNYGYTSIIAFKNEVHHDILNDLRKSGFKISTLPKNPYL